MLIGTLPTHVSAASRQAVLYDIACLEQGARHRAFGSMPAALSRMLHQTADCLLRTGGFPYAAGLQEEGERSFARRIKHLTSLMPLIPPIPSCRGHAECVQAGRLWNACRADVLFIPLLVCLSGVLLCVRHRLVQS
jgi:hypothetical protein